MILKNHAKIKSILSQCCDEDKGLVFTEDKVAIYLYKNGCLFPSALRGGELSIHAAVPKHLRGAIAVDAAKSVISWALKHLNIKRVTARIDVNRRKVNIFAILAGMRLVGSDEKFKYYEAVQ